LTAKEGPGGVEPAEARNTEALCEETTMQFKRIRAAVVEPLDRREPSAAELAAIDAEWPLIAAELAVVAAEAEIAAAGAAVTDLARRRLRRANRRVLSAAAMLASGAQLGGEAA
jgi:hypothetical protein